jgi:hypothetical protein
MKIKSRLESLKKFEERVVLTKDDLHHFRGGNVDCDTCTPDGVMHCDHLNTDTGDFGPDIKIDPISYKV